MEGKADIAVVVLSVVNNTSIADIEGLLIFGRNARFKNPSVIFALTEATKRVWGPPADSKISKFSRRTLPSTSTSKIRFPDMAKY